MDYEQQVAAGPDQQMLMAEVLRRRRAQAEAMQAANAQANQFNNLAAMAQMGNNSGAAAAAKMAMMNAQAQHKPVNLGAQGFALPSTGDFVASPMYEDEQNARREEKRFLLAQTLAARQQAAQEAEQGRNDRAAEQRALRLTLAGMANGAREDRRAQAAQEKAEKDKVKAEGALDKDLQRYSGVLEKAGIPAFDQALQTAESVLNKYKPGEIPGFGRFVGAVPTALLGDEAQLARTDMQGAANILLKSRSGAAVTDSEMRRFLQEVASGAGMSEAALRKGWANVRKVYEKQAGSLAAGFSPDVHAEYMRRGGSDYRPKPVSATPGKPSSGKAPAGIPQAEWDHMTPEERALWPS